MSANKLRILSVSSGCCSFRTWFRTLLLICFSFLHFEVRDTFLVGRGWKSQKWPHMRMNGQRNDSEYVLRALFGCSSLHFVHPQHQSYKKSLQEVHLPSALSQSQFDRDIGVSSLADSRWSFIVGSGEWHGLIRSCSGFSCEKRGLRYIRGSPEHISRGRFHVDPDLHCLCRPTAVLSSILFADVTPAGQRLPFSRSPRTLEGTQPLPCVHHIRQWRRRALGVDAPPGAQLGVHRGPLARRAGRGRRRSAQGAPRPLPKARARPPHDARAEVPRCPATSHPTAAPLAVCADAHGVACDILGPVQVRPRPCGGRGALAAGMGDLP